MSSYDLCFKRFNTYHIMVFNKVTELLKIELTETEVDVLVLVRHHATFLLPKHPGQDVAQQEQVGCLHVRVNLDDVRLRVVQEVAEVPPMR